ncbi:MAG: hypothetical protein LBQ38_01385, partial [Spirochaetaceae bacterium]|nr:hypothetical protein [Spirochaetaceae bacterium]
MGFAQREEKKGQNYSVPLRSTPQFFQLIYAALFYAAISRSIKGRRKAGTKEPGYGVMLNSIQTENTATSRRSIYPQPHPASCRSWSGQGGLILTPPLPCLFGTSMVTAAVLPTLNLPEFGKANKLYNSMSRRNYGQEEALYSRREDP